MAPKRGLGRGMNDLIPTDVSDAGTKSSNSKNSGLKKVSSKKQSSDSSAVKTEVSELKVKVTDIEPNPNQPRTEFNEDALNELAESIKKFGIIEPIRSERAHV